METNFKLYSLKSGFIAHLNSDFFKLRQELMGALLMLDTDIAYIVTRRLIHEFNRLNGDFWK